MLINEWGTLHWHFSTTVKNIILHNDSHIWSLESAKVHNLALRTRLDIWTVERDLHSERVLWNVYILCPKCCEDSVWIWHCGTKVILLKCFKGFWNLKCYVSVCLSGGIRACVCGCVSRWCWVTNFIQSILINKCPKLSCLITDSVVCLLRRITDCVVFCMCHTVVYKLL